MNWFRENRWLGTFLVVSGVAFLLALWFLWSAKSSADDATEQFNNAATERSRLEALDPFPSDSNVRKMKVHIDNYATALDRLKNELKLHMLPAAPLQPNEFQSRLRQAMLAVGEKARASKVKLPDNFALGFEQYTTALPATEEAPVLGQELAQAELLANILIESRVDAVTAFKTAALAAPTPAPATAGPVKPATTPASAGPKLVERAILDVTFTAAPSAMRRVLNQIASAPQQFYIVRALHVRNEKEKGPPREQSAGTPGAAAPPANAADTAATTSPAAKTPAAAVTFIVGNEHVETSARVELVRFTY